MCLLESNARAEHSIAIHFQELQELSFHARVLNPIPGSKPPPIAIPGMANANTIKNAIPRPTKLQRTPQEQAAAERL